MTKRTNKQWLQELRSSGPTHAAALSDLYKILVSGLRRGLVGRVNTSLPEFEALAEDFAQEALLRILDKLDTFAGRSQFTTWAHKIAVSVALTELRRKRWQDYSLDGLLARESGEYTPSFIADPAAPKPENTLERKETLALVARLISEELTEKQQMVLVTAIIQGHSAAEVAARMNSNPNAVNKLLHDARLRLKRNLAQIGLSPTELIAIFT